MELEGRPPARNSKMVDWGAGQPWTGGWMGMGPASRGCIWMGEVEVERSWMAIREVERGRESAVVSGRARVRRREKGRKGGCIFASLGGLAWGGMLVKRLELCRLRGLERGPAKDVVDLNGVELDQGVMVREDANQ